MTPIRPIPPSFRRPRVRDTLNALAVVIAVLALQLDGCTLIGFGIGLGHDAQRPKAGPIAGEIWSSIPIGERVIVQFAEGTQTKGIFFGTERLTGASFDSAEAHWRAMYVLPPMPIPLGTTVTLTQKAGSAISGRLLGFDQQITPDGRIPQIWIVPVGDSVSMPYNLSGVATITADGNAATDVARLQGMINRGEIPSLTVLTLQTKSSLENIPINRVVGISYPRKHGALIGLGIGFGVDLVCLGLSLLFMKLFEDAWGGESWGG